MAPEILQTVPPPTYYGEDFITEKIRKRMVILEKDRELTLSDFAKWINNLPDEEKNQTIKSRDGVNVIEFYEVKISRLMRGILLK